MVITKAIYSMLFCKSCLCNACFFETKVIEAEVRRQMRLIVIFKQCLSLYYIRPFCKTFTPPFIIFRYWMKLRKVNGYGPYGMVSHFKKPPLQKRPFIFL